MKRDARWLTWTLTLVLLWGAGLAPSALAEEADGGSCWPSRPGTDPSLCPPDDPKYREHWEYRSDIPPEVDRDKMHPAELELGAVGISLDRAWQHTIGRDDVVIAVLDSGIRWRSAELLRKLYLNRDELPLPEGSTDHDANGDGIFNIEDYAGDTRVRDANENGVLDPGDLIRAFSDCVDDDRNGYPDDICGYDFFSDDTRCGVAGQDNDAWDATDFGHGTGIAASAAADTNNGAGDVGGVPEVPRAAGASRG